MRSAWKLGLALAGVLVIGGTAVALADGPRGGRWAGPHGFGPGGGPMGMLEELDTNKDGKLTKAEVDAARGERLKRFDTDGDGRLSLTEYQALWLEAMRPQMVRQFQAHDRDGDAQVTVEEFTFRLDRMIDRLDRDGDGTVTRAELMPPKHRDRDRDHDRDDD